jgi:molybdate transport system regulatory protein
LLFFVPSKVRKFAVEPRIRVHFGNGLFVGPGKAELLEHIDRTGSIGNAAKAMGMSYMRAWTLIKSLDTGFAEPLVAKSRGGLARGGARLTETGRQVVALYREMEASSKSAAHSAGERLRKLLKS